MGGGLVGDRVPVTRLENMPTVTFQFAFGRSERDPFSKIHGLCESEMGFTGVGRLSLFFNRETRESLQAPEERESIVTNCGARRCRPRHHRKPAFRIAGQGPQAMTESDSHWPLAGRMQPLDFSSSTACRLLISSCRSRPCREVRLHQTRDW